MKIYDPAKRKADYEWYKTRHICTRCRSQQAFDGMTMCPACLERNSAHVAEWRKRNPQRAQESSKRCYDRKRSEGQCVKCGKPNPNAGNNCRCPKCARDWKVWRKTNRVRSVKPDGICRICDKPVYEGKKLCEAHWIEAKQRLLAVRCGNERHAWRADERVRLRQVWVETERENARMMADERLQR